MSGVRAVVFDWGGTLMREFPQFQGPMACWPHVELVSGVAEVLEELHKALVCCVASNARASDSRLLGLALARVGIRQYFQHIFTSRELGVEKPDPAFFHKVLQRLGVEPSECIMVGDDYLKDITGAKSAGMCTVWFSEHPVTEPAPSANAVIGSMRDLPHAVREISASTQESTS